jgi:hypothetical protein
MEDLKFVSLKGSSRFWLSEWDESATPPRGAGRSRRRRSERGEPPRADLPGLDGPDSPAVGLSEGDGSPGPAQRGGARPRRLRGKKVPRSHRRAA